MGKTVAQKLKASGIESTGFNKMRSFAPSDIRVEMRENSSRGDFYTFAEQLPEVAKWSNVSDSCCFKREEIEKRLASLLSTSPLGQKMSVECYLDNLGRPVLTSGFLRWAAYALAESRGIMGEIAGGAAGLRCTIVAMPKDGDDRLALAISNYVENEERLDPTPIDTARFYETQLKTSGLSRPEFAARLGITSDHLNKHLRLCALPISKQLDMREGRLKFTAALAWMRDNGEGPATGPRPPSKKVKHSMITRALEAHASEAEVYAPWLLDGDGHGHSDAEVFALLQYIAGLEGDHEPPAKFVKFLAGAPAKPPGKRGRKKKAPEAGNGVAPGKDAKS